MKKLISLFVLAILLGIVSKSYAEKPDALFGVTVLTNTSDKIGWEIEAGGMGSNFGIGFQAGFFPTVDSLRQSSTVLKVPFFIPVGKKVFLKIAPGIETFKFKQEYLLPETAFCLGLGAGFPVHRALYLATQVNINFENGYMGFSSIGFTIGLKL